MKFINNQTIIYHPEVDLKFSEYGIEIPIVDDRAFKVFSYLKSLYPELSEISLKDIPSISIHDLERVHNQDYIARLFADYRSLELEMLKTYELIDEEGEYHRYNPHQARLNFEDARNKIMLQVGATYLAFNRALENQFAYFLGGGMHHAMTFSGRGFCLVNDILIGLGKLINDKKIQSAWVIDVDVHKGDGTAEIVAMKPKLFSKVKLLSIHMKEGWPLNSGSVRDPWFIPSHIDIGMDAFDDENYLNRLNEGLNKLFEFEKPDLCVVVNGADPYKEDVLESSKLINLSKSQMLERDQMIFNFLLKNKIPQAYLMAGGYGEKSHEIYEQFLEFVGQRSS